MKTNMAISDTVSIRHIRGDRYIKDGMVGVVYSPNFGAGFSTWGVSAMATDPKIVEIVLDMIDSENARDSVRSNNLDEELARYVKETYDRNYYAQQLAVAWLGPGTRFFIKEYDGAETIETENDIEWSVA